MHGPFFRNSLSLDMIKVIHDAVSHHEPSTRCVVLKARGPVFSAGHNLKHIVSKCMCGVHEFSLHCINFKILLVSVCVWCPRVLIALH